MNDNDVNQSEMVNQLNDGLDNEPSVDGLEAPNDGLEAKEIVNESNDDLDDSNEVKNDSNEALKESNEALDESKEALKESNNDLEESNEDLNESTIPTADIAETIPKQVETVDDNVSLISQTIANEVEYASSFNPEEEQVSDDQEESTIINNDNYDVNNDSAYETNEILSQNGSSSRLQSAGTTEGDVDHETGENFLQEKEETEIINAEASEIERLENELENPPSPTDDDYDVILLADNPTETGVSSTTGNEVANDEVHE